MAVGKAFFAVMLLAGLAWAQAGMPKSSMAGGRRKPAAKKHAPVPEPVAVPQDNAPPAPLRPSQMPAVPPRVSYQNGQLTIVAENSTMADIIAQVRAATGIKIETVGGPSGDRVAARIGPAPVRDVILSLVQGSQYDFIILGALNDPNAVERVILTPKMGSGAVTAASRPQPPQPAGNMVYQAPVMETSDDEGNEGFAAPPPQAAPAAPGDPNAAPKTPEQLLEELRRMEEQRNNPQGRPQRPPR